MAFLRTPIVLAVLLASFSVGAALVQQKHKTKIYVGEFSVAGWALGADRYLDDCIAIFREYGWDWTYHAFREWPGWSVEHEPVKYGVADDCFKPSPDNPRKRALLKGILDGNDGTRL